MPSLNEYIKTNSDFKSSVNLYLSLNKLEKIRGFIPTKSSVNILGAYLDSVLANKNQATILLGPYGKGKSHLLLVLLAILSLDRTDKNNVKAIKDLIARVKKVDVTVSESIKFVWENKGQYLPVIINGAEDDLHKPFIIGINDALKRDGLEELIPETHYGHALECIKRWQDDYPETYEELTRTLQEYDETIGSFKKKLKAYDSDTLALFKDIYSNLTSGGDFNPLVNEDVLPIYKSISSQLVENYGYSGIYIIFDEFSKFIEGQNKKTSGNNMKLLQDVCELACDSSDSQIFITMVAHKGIKEYGSFLSKDIINSFTGIEGRIKEVQFVTSTKNNYELIQNAIFKDDKVFSTPKVKKYLSGKIASDSFNVPAFRSTFNQKDYDEIVLKGCFPLTPISAYLLLNVSEKVAQNERTLFTFISNEEQGSMADYIAKHTNDLSWFVNADIIYDYFKQLFKKSVTNEYVHNEWLNAEYALSQALTDSESVVLKTLALINIVNKPGELPANEKTLVLAAGATGSITDSISSLEERGLIYKKASDNTFAFKTKATADVRNELTKRKNYRINTVSYSRLLESISEKKYILPRKYNYDYQMTRFFNVRFMDVEDFLNVNDSKVYFEDEKGPCNVSDGTVLILFKLNDKNYKDHVLEKCSSLKEPRMVVVYSDIVCSVTEALRDYDALVNDLEKDTVFFSKPENMVLKSEFPIIKQEIQSQIIDYIDSAYGDVAKNWIFYYLNGTIETDSMKLVDVVDEIVYKIYGDAIRINNELINKKRITTAPIKKARLNIISAIIRHDADLIASYSAVTSADSTIYRAVFTNSDFEGSSFAKSIDSFINSCGNKRRSLRKLMDKLTSSPYGVRAGVIPMYLASSLSARDEDVVLYFSDKEIPIDENSIVNMCENPDDYSLYISLEDAKKDAYLKDLTKLFVKNEESETNETRISCIYLAMQRWFRGLPQVTKNIKSNNPIVNDPVVLKAFVKIKGLLQSLDGNPYDTLFVGIPAAFEKDDLLDVYKQFERLYDIANAYYDNLRFKIVKETAKIFGSKSKQELRNILREWYDKQSDSVKNGLYSNQINDFLKLISSNQYRDEYSLAEMLSKIVNGVYCDSWNDNSFDEYSKRLQELKASIEDLNKGNNGRQETLIFTSHDGNKITQKYDLIDEGTGVILKNIISDALDDYADLPVNDKVAILLQMIERTLGQEN